MRRPSGPGSSSTVTHRGTRPFFGLLLLVLVAGCAVKPPPKPAPQRAPDWQAAIGSLEITNSPQICTAVLVRQDLIVTASHCLHPDGIAVDPGRLVFVSSDMEQRSQGVTIFGQGGEVTPGTIHKDQAQLDWALVKITPPMRLKPLKVAPLSAAEARAEIAKGARFYSAGYGQGAKDRLRAHERCGLLPPDPEGLTEGDLFFATNCIVRLGDSGGAVAIVKGDEPELIGLTVGFTDHPTTGEPIGIVVSAKAFAPFIGSGLISALTRPVEKSSMN